jgi:hypothetical protein
MFANDGSEFKLNDIWLILTVIADVHQVFQFKTAGLSNP